ncbi:putative nonribosomal peptide synthetase [Rosellinia necatrix]|uniref:Putative nonribosomal peptide synthetase n=1 Tax=Rosellinia necatrix TaxID=77044 RepID=A0A1W2TFV8_ROSNE|nr:putative nonribosomal peptide synthetase [Rosellinia necatrix]
MNGSAHKPTDNGAEQDYGRRLLPHVVDHIARTDPQRECFSIPRTSDPKDGWKIVTFKQYANAINHVARRITELSGPAQAGTFPTIAYVGPNDARYVVLTLAAVKAGYKALFISPRNSQEGQLSLFEKTDCHILTFPKSHRNMVQPWLQEREMQAIEVGTTDSWFPEHEVEPFPYSKTFEEAEWEPLCVLHTSGSTGIPKPIIVRQGMMAICDQYLKRPDWKGTKMFLKGFSENSKRNFIPMPLFHAAALYSFLSTVIYYGTPAALGLPDRPLSAESVLSCLEHLDVQATMLPPAILEDMSQSDHYIEALKKLNLVFFGGGNLVREAGNRLVEKGVNLNNLISATEFVPFPIYLQPDSKLWQYFIINSEEFGADWRKVNGENDVYRLVIVRKDKNPGLQGFFYTFPDLNEYDTKDLYKPHPTLADHWIYYGRSDNIIVFSNGEKLNPVTIEEIVSDHPELSGALVVGEGRFQPSLLLEPTLLPKTEAETNELIDRIWPLVVTANKETVAHGQIGRDFIMVVTPEKPFLRAGKGTVQRAGTVKLYKDEIDAFYEKVEQGSNVDAPQLDLSSENGLIASIQDLFYARLGAQQKLPPDADFFSSGIDSMQVIGASRLLRAGLEAAGYHINADAVATRVIYGNPTAERLAKYLLSRVAQNGESAPQEDDGEHDVESARALWQKYTTDLPKAQPGRPDPSNDEQTVILTGSTGMLGSYMLDQMVKNPAVKKVICLNRADDGGKKRQALAMQERGLTTDFESKCTFLHADMSRSDFGLPRETFDELLGSADRIIHNAWPVNFNIPVESFEPHIRSARTIGDFASRAAKRTAVIFISSIGTGDRWDARSGPLPEVRLENLALPAGGYGLSKLVGSLVLEDTARAGDFPAAVIRVGQIAGPEAAAGVWNRQEWLPSIVASSVHLGALPATLGSMERVDWTAVESVAGLVLDVAGISQAVAAADVAGYYHGVNPAATTWAALAPTVQAFYKIPQVVSFADWVKRLEASQSEGIQALDRNPGVKLLDSYRAMAAAAGNPVVFDMARTKERSPSMRNAKPITPDLMRHWCQQWSF